jgi:hypothetical protein
MLHSASADLAVMRVLVAANTSRAGELQPSVELRPSMLSASHTLHVFEFTSITSMSALAAMQLLFCCQMRALVA